MIPVGFGPSFPVRTATPRPGRAPSSLGSPIAQHAGQDRFSGKKKDKVPAHIPAEKVEETKEKIADTENNSAYKTGLALTAAGWGALLAGAPLLSIPLNSAGAALQGKALTDRAELEDLKEALDKKIK